MKNARTRGDRLAPAALALALLFAAPPSTAGEATVHEVAEGDVAALRIAGWKLGDPLTVDPDRFEVLRSYLDAHLLRLAGGETVRAFGVTFDEAEFALVEGRLVQIDLRLAATAGNGEAVDQAVDRMCAGDTRSPTGCVDVGDAHSIMVSSREQDGARDLRARLKIEHPLTHDVPRTVDDSVQSFEWAGGGTWQRVEGGWVYHGAITSMPDVGYGAGAALDKQAARGAFEVLELYQLGMLRLTHIEVAYLETGQVRWSVVPGVKGAPGDETLASVDATVADAGEQYGAPVWTTHTLETEIQGPFWLQFQVLDGNPVVAGVRAAAAERLAFRGTADEPFQTKRGLPLIRAHFQSVPAKR